MIVYRPHRGGLMEALAEAKEFRTIWGMKRYIVKEWAYYGKPFKAKDIVIDKKVIDDERCGWHDTRYVCVKRMGDEVYSVPQCIGMCATDYEKGQNHLRKMVKFVMGR